MKDIRELAAEKIAEIRAAGDKAYRERSVGLFHGYSEDLKFRAIVSAVGVIERSPLLWELHAIVDPEGIAAVAGVDFPLAMTLVEAEAGEGAWARLDRLWGDIDAYFMTNADAARLTIGHELQFSEIVADDSGSVLIFSSAVVESVQNTRRELGSIFERHGLAAPLEPTASLALVRLKAWSPVAHPERLSSFRQALDAFSQGIALRPTSFKIKQFYRGSAFDLLTGGITV